MCSPRIWFDNVVAKGRKLNFPAIIALVVAIPLLFAFFKGGLVDILKSDRWLDAEQMGNVQEALESYLNPNFDPEDDSPMRGYRLLIAYLGAFFLNGLLISIFVSWIERRRNRWEQGDLHYHRGLWIHHKFSVVIGGNEMVPKLVIQLLKQKGDDKLDYVFVMTNRDVPLLRNKLSSVIKERLDRVIIYYGERTSEEDLRLLRLKDAKEIYVIGESVDIDQTGSHHDVKNMDCVQKMAGLLKEANCKEKKTCRVMFEYQSTFSVFQFADVCGSISDVLNFKPFNYYETWAQKVLVCSGIGAENSATAYLPLEGKAPMTADSEDSVHLIVVGMSRMGIAMAVEAAHIAHYPNFITKGKRTRITFIDSAARQEMNFFQGHYKELFAVSRWRYMRALPMEMNYEDTILFEDGIWHDPLNDLKSQSPYKTQGTHGSADYYTLGDSVVDVEWQFLEGDLEMPSVQNYISNEARNRHRRLTIAICFPRDNASLAASLYLPDAVYENGSSVQQVLVYQPYGDAMRRSFNDTTDKMKSYRLFEKLRAFGMLGGCYSVEFQQSLDTLSSAFGNAYETVSQTMRGGLRGNKLIGSKWKKPVGVGKSLAARQWSNIYNGQHMWTKLRSVEYEENKSFEWDESVVNLLAQVEHTRWNMEQLLLGFAPLKADEQRDMIKAFGKKKPEELIKKLIAGEKADVSIISEWLSSWENFDAKKEIYKADMSHLDICSNERLREIDSDTVIYDVELVRILPELYAKIASQN